MTKVESMMLSVCFGATVGLILGSWWFLIKEWIKDRKEKKKKKEQ
ncbi:MULTISPECIES: hypothetical protein [Bacillota]|nr:MULTISPECIES: hypothetical protein [Bacillota]